MGLVDLAVLGRLGARELGAAGLGNAIFFAISILGIGINLGVDPMISQAFGAGDAVRARHVMWQGVWLALGVTVALTIVLLFAPLLLPLFDVAEPLRPIASQFLLVRTAGLAPMLLFFVLRAYLQSQHITRPMVVAMLIGNVFNFIADLILVFGWGPFPRMGVAGAALSTDLGAVLQLAVVCLDREVDSPPAARCRRAAPSEMAGDPPGHSHRPADRNSVGGGDRSLRAGRPAGRPPRRRSISPRTSS